MNLRPIPRQPGSPSALSAHAQPMRDGRNADSLRRRQRVNTVLERVAAEGGEISVSAIARLAGVDRTFLYRHHDLLAKIHAQQTEPSVAEGAGPAVTRTSMQADLCAAHERAVRLNTRVQHLESVYPKLSAKKSGARPGSAPQPTSTTSIRRSHASNNG